MATQIRQSNLFAAEDWKVVYESFRKIDLQSYDYDTIRTAMINHLRTTYPDNFNDWIGNQEFIFILDTLCFLGQNLAFRMDLNTRENFIDTAERRESVLRLANMLAYSPRRNYPARGLVKINEVTTTMDVRDSNGVSLASKAIKWNDPLNPNWYEQFIIVLNANLVESNPFGDPVKRMIKDGIQTQVYRLSTLDFSSIAEPFSATVNGQSMSFEIVNPDVNTEGQVFERNPNPQESRFLIYRNDGNGFSSPNTGFFLMFKQGTLKFEDYLFTKQVESRVQNVNVANINELDVWVQQIADNGVVTKHWTKAPTAQNIMYNSVSQQIKELFSVVTRDDDMVSIRFPDSNSGTIPRGSFRAWYRVSNGLSYTIKTTDMQNKSITYRTRNASQTQNEESTLNFKFSLEYQVQNAQSQETIDQIRVRAPQMYYTSNRLITGEDYNIGPMRQGNLVKKSKAINRTYSGHSRFIDINDPTGKYQNTNVFADDGSIYKDTTSAFKRATETLPTNKPESAIIAQKLQPLITYSGVRQLYDEQIGMWHTDAARREGFRQKNTQIVEWRADMTKAPYGAVGKFTFDFVTGPVQAGMLINMHNLDNTLQSKWVSVISYDTSSKEARLSEEVPSGWSVNTFYAPLRTTFNFEEVNNITREMYKRSDFGIWYDAFAMQWKVTTLSTEYDFTKEFNIKTNPSILKVEYNGNSWDFTARGVDYVFVGGDYVKFFFVNTDKLSDLSSGIAQQDFIKILRSNHNPQTGLAYTTDIGFHIDSVVTQEDGRVDPDRVRIKSQLSDANGIPLHPEIFTEVVPKNASEEIELFWEINTDNVETQIKLPNAKFFVYDAAYNPNDVKNQFRKHEAYRTTLDNTKPIGTVFYYRPLDIFVRYDVERLTSGSGGYSETVLDPVRMTNESTRTPYLTSLGLSQVYNYRDRKGRTDLMYQWKHYAPDDHRIDPAITNIQDIFVLTTAYYNKIQFWAKSTTPGAIPKPETSAELKATFPSVESIKASSDAIVWHSGSFVPLFGVTADDAYRATFRVVRAPGSRYSDDEIRQRVIRLINEYFAIENWDFGETFYFTELSTYIHQKLATDIASIVIVPKNPASKFGTLFQITCEPSELFISTAKVTDVEIVNALTTSNIQVGT